MKGKQHIFFKVFQRAEPVTMLHNNADNPIHI